MEVKIMGKTKLTISLDEEVVSEMEKIREKVGIAISSQIEMKLKGFSIVDNEVLRKCGIEPSPFKIPK